MTTVSWKVLPSESGIKLQQFLKEKLGEEFSLRQIKRAIESNDCTVNGKVERFATTVLAPGDLVSLHISTLPQTKSHAFEKERIVYEDESLLIYNKPAGIPSMDQGVAELICSNYKPVKLVHRLDRDTTGLLLFAKNELVLQKMIQLFREKKISKVYLALVDGLVEKAGVIENELGKLSIYQGQSIWGKVEKGLYARTEWRCEVLGNGASLVSCQPITGRTHQIRVHMKELGHPILGDYQYGTKFSCPIKPKRCLLHAWKLHFPHPVTGKIIDIQAPIPSDFLEACATLKISLEAL